MKITPERLSEILFYDSATGYISRISNGRRLIPDENNCVIVSDTVAGVSAKIKYDKLAYMLAYRKVIKDNQRVLHKNLDQEDCSLQNLVLVSREVFLKVKEAHRNLETGIKMVAHKNDQFSYVVQWYESGKPRKKLVRDVVSAQKMMLRLRLKYSKILTRYCVFD